MSVNGSGGRCAITETTLKSEVFYQKNPLRSKVESRRKKESTVLDLSLIFCLTLYLSDTTGLQQKKKKGFLFFALFTSSRIFDIFEFSYLICY